VSNARPRWDARFALAFSPLAASLGTARIPDDDRRSEARMDIQLATVLIASALIGSIVLFFERGDRVVPVVALIAAGIEALLHFDIISLSSGKFRIDVILPALLVIAGGVCWTRTSTKSTITAATAVFAVGALQLLGALGMLR